MEFRIADTFTASLIKLPVGEQKLVKQTAFDAFSPAFAPFPLVAI